MPKLSLLLVAFALAGCAKKERIAIQNVPIDDVTILDNDGNLNSSALGVSQNHGNACLSNDIDDLPGFINGGECDADPATDYELDKQLKISATLSAADTTSGGRIEVRVVFENVSREKLSLYFYRDPEVEFPIVALNNKGNDVTFPAGGAPSKFGGSIGRIVLFPKGVIKLKLPYYAVRYKWKKTGDQRDLIEAGGLGRGEYKMRLLFPFAGKVSKENLSLELPFRVR